MPKYDCDRDETPVIVLNNRPNSACTHTPVITVPIAEGGDTIQLNLTINLVDEDQAKLDFYFLIDATGSFRNARATFATKANDLVKSIQQLSQSVAIGYGTFVDKNSTSGRASTT